VGTIIFSTVPMATVCPSGRALTRAEIPIAPPPPGLFTVTTGTFKNFSMDLDNIRLNRSGWAPGPKRQMLLIVPVGYFSPAAQEVLNDKMKNKRDRIVNKETSFFFISSSLKDIGPASLHGSKARAFRRGSEESLPKEAGFFTLSIPSLCRTPLSAPLSEAVSSA
jgi:hypothetical protein